MIRFLPIAMCLMLFMAVNNSCGLGLPKDPEFPSYVSYSISGDVLSLTGPDQLLRDVRAWLSENAIYIESRVDYSTGDPSEFVQTDAAAIKRYQEEYIPKFKAYLNELNATIARGTYGAVDAVKITFCTYARREQGQQNTLKYEQYEFSYPVTTDGHTQNQ